MLRSLALS
jgi:hypothetical protein